MTETIKILCFTVLVMVSLIGLSIYSENHYVKQPLEDFCRNINNSELVEYKTQWCSSVSSDYLVKCSDGEIYGVDTTKYCEKWNTWGDCIKHGKTKFILSHLTYPRC